MEIDREKLKHDLLRKRFTGEAYWKIVGQRKDNFLPDETIAIFHGTYEQAVDYIVDYAEKNSDRFLVGDIDLFESPIVEPQQEELGRDSIRFDFIFAKDNPQTWYLDCYQNSPIRTKDFPVASYGPASLSDVTELGRFLFPYFDRLEVTLSTAGVNPLPRDRWPVVSDNTQEEGYVNASE